MACLLLCFLVVGCHEQKRAPQAAISHAEKIIVNYAKGFTVERNGEFIVLEVTSPWPGADKGFRYALVPREKLSSITLPRDGYDAIVPIPVNNMVVTSTTHIPALEALGGLNKLIGFPDTKYISSKAARKLIAEEKILELGSNESLNTEMVLALKPEVLVGFSVSNQNSAYSIIENAGIPVTYNGDWVEQSPLGKAEWIKFFGVLLGKEKEADSIFNEIEKSYQEIKSIAAKVDKKSTVLSGALYKDVWYLPGGESWAARFIEDANAAYLWSDTEGTGSLGLSLEAVLEKGQEADFWLAPSQFTTYEEMKTANNHYQRFKAFKEKHVYTVAFTKGETGGLLYYELAPQRPDLVLKDLVYIFHPELLSEYNPFFFKPLR
ncbi:ABC transporter substrate-binding protein [Allomuricauda sp. SCSIO 65647]|uniref:ABC transporter substrate-binding protein n=1 Tax=Allomuricauda sp. SCSIO 65647 TaxID=2908843 RepID=UPI001F288790|nr:ABC transporter substrate-binding protein [Muricauda sp. SCSIO 65647]UJH67675.1 ABC transporter substrate-binding protein [Muricauda sp. SCSIO 65647]